MDRPSQGHRYFNCEYVQPQWVFDSANARMLLPVSRYAPGASLPPHLSPFVDDKEEGYVPEYRKEVAQMKSAKEAYSTGNDHEEDEEAGEDGRAEVEDEETKHARELRAEIEGVSFSQAASAAADDEQDDEQDDEDDGEEEEEEGEDEGGNEEEEDEGDNDQVPKTKPKTEDEENHELALIMMPKKAKRLYGRMQHGIDKKAERVRALEQKNKRLKKTKAGGGE